VVERKQPTKGNFILERRAMLRRVDDPHVAAIRSVLRQAETKQGKEAGSKMWPDRSRLAAGQGRASLAWAGKSASAAAGSGCATRGHTSAQTGSAGGLAEARHPKRLTFFDRRGRLPHVGR